MTSHEASAPHGARTGPLPFDTSVAHQARIYDYLLGRQGQLLRRPGRGRGTDGDLAGDDLHARANRAFLGRAVRYLAGEAGIRQFLDIGTGIPTAGNTHQVAQAIAPESRVVYVDYDPIVLAHARALLISGQAGATDYIDADLRDTGTILSQAAKLLDFTQPVAVTLLAILNAIPDSDGPYAIVDRLLDSVPSGSYLVISHGGSDLLGRQALDGLTDVADRRIQQKVVYRTHEQVARFFDGTDLVEPGLVRIEEWRPERGAGEKGQSSGWCAVGRKR